jgi:hypothetical protein
MDAVLTTMPDPAKVASPFEVVRGIAESALDDNLKRCIHRTDLEQFRVRARQ